MNAFRSRADSFASDDTFKQERIGTAVQAAVSADRGQRITDQASVNRDEIHASSHFNRPEQNFTGIITMNRELMPKRLELLDARRLAHEPAHDAQIEHLGLEPSDRHATEPPVVGVVSRRLAVRRRGDRVVAPQSRVRGG